MGIGTTEFANGEEMMKPLGLSPIGLKKRCNLEHEMCLEDGQVRVDGRIMDQDRGPRRGQGGPKRSLEGSEEAQSSKTVVRQSQNWFGGRYWVSGASPKLEESGPPRSGKALSFEKRSPRKGW